MQRIEHWDSVTCGIAARTDFFDRFERNLRIMLVQCPKCRDKGSDSSCPYCPPGQGAITWKSWLFFAVLAIAIAILNFANLYDALHIP